VGVKGTAFIAGAFEHPGRNLPDKTVHQIHAECAVGALADAGLGFDDVDGYFCAGDAFGGVNSMSDYLGLHPRFIDSTDTGGSSYVAHLGHAAAAIAAGKCSIALVTLGGKPRTGQVAVLDTRSPETGFETVYGSAHAPVSYALAAQRHMYQYGTTAEQLAMVRVAASIHAQHNPNAFLREVVTVEQVLESPMVSDPLHRLDCCVVTDGGGALVVVSPGVAHCLDRHCIPVLGHGESPKHTEGGHIDVTYTGAVWSGPRAFDEAGVTPADIDYASLYDSFTITVIVQLEDLGFCEKGKGGTFVQGGALLAPHGALPFNTDGGGLCSNHPANRGGMTKVIEAVRQLRGEASAAVQVPECELAVVQGTGGFMGTRMGSATVILGREWP
jgi:acetyl-CoA C-acetyltransferase